MTISAAIKRLQILEDNHGGQTEIVGLSVIGWPEGSGDEIATVDKVVFDVLTVESRKACYLMPQDYWETVCPKGVTYP